MRALILLTFLEKSYSGHPNDITVLVHINYGFLDEQSANSDVSIMYQTKSDIKSNACC